MAENVSSLSQFEKHVRGPAAPLVVAYFWASWSAPCKQIDAVIEQLAKDNQAVQFLRVEAEAVPDVAEKYEIAVVPVVVFFQGGKAIDRVEGANVPELAKRVTQHAKAAPVSTSPPKSAQATPKAQSAVPIEETLKRLVSYAPVMVFMKGTRVEAKCGFSRTLIEILTKHKANYSTFDILSDQDVRAGLKVFSNWPTYPQLYVDGKLVGGLDIIKELDEEDELADILSAGASAGNISKEASAKEPIEKRLTALTNQAPVMLFMKGDPTTPKCGFSSKMIALLNDNGVTFSTFDILSDNDVRQGLKTFSNWPTFPQLYVEGKLIGGLDIVKEMAEEDELLDVIPTGAKSA
eukprot:TRINITY_DN4042_c0_g1_i1.p1 TRINITY_DN4042_c0_g1~~TRINITY_DN4042_c0_g1_i1.p1  ORF type:complete len:380 (-),score=102.39 TRINITY_DN4042_c0_g1_i1:164-1210(-)